MTGVASTPSNMIPRTPAAASVSCIFKPPSQYFNVLPATVASSNSAPGPNNVLKLCSSTCTHMVRDSAEET